MPSRAMSLPGGVGTLKDSLTRDAQGRNVA
jgi:hypothetical protein